MDRIVRLHEDACQYRVKQSDGERPLEGGEKPTGSQLDRPIEIDKPLITPEQLFDFQITQVKIF